MKLIKNIKLYHWVLIGIFSGVILGFILPHIAKEMKPLSDGFISFLKMLIPPIIFCNVVLGFQGKLEENNNKNNPNDSNNSNKSLSKIMIYGMLYFLFASTLALFVGLLMAHLLKPGIVTGIDFQAFSQTLTNQKLPETKQIASMNQFFLNIIPKTFFDAFTHNGNLLQVLFIGVLFGLGLKSVSNKSKTTNSNTSIITDGIHILNEVFLKILEKGMFFAPLGAFAAMATTIGTYGISSLLVLIKLVLSFYITSISFIILFLGGTCFYLKIPFFGILKFIKEELLTVLGTSSSESVLASIMVKLEKLGCPKAVVGVIVPMGYSFNLDGTNICLTLSMMFIAQAFNIPISWQEQLLIIGIMMISSKGAAAVVGSAFITLSATLALFPQFPIAGLMLIYGVDRFLSEGRSLTNLVGNTFATLFLCRWNNLLDEQKMNQSLNQKD